MDDDQTHISQRPLRTPRAAAMAGIIFAILQITAIVLLQVAIPADSFTTNDWLAEQSGKNPLALGLLPFAGIAFLWFLGVLRDRLGHREDQFFSTLFFGSGLLYLAMTFVTAAIAGGLLAVYAFDPDLYWSARGQLGIAFEKSGDLDSAIEHYQKAISEGSTDRNTYTRCLINFEKLKNYDDALRIVHKGLKVQKDAAWETDLRKREERLMKKTGAIPKGSPKKIIPDFAIRKGQKSISLLQQIQYSPQLSAAACIKNRIFGISGGKSPKLIAHNLGSESHAWQVELPKKADNILASKGNIILYSRDGSVGDGETQIFFYDLNGKAVAHHRLPDVPSNVVLGGDIVYAGCRNGKLYAFSAGGKALWNYTVPGSKKEPDSPYSRPCPYFISAGKDVVAFSSFENVFVLNPKGKSLYRWNTPERKSTSKSELFTISILTGSSAIRAISAAETGNHVLIASDDSIYELMDKKVIRQVKPRVDHINSISFSPAGDLWAISAADKIILFQNGKKANSFPLQGYGSVHFNQAANRIIGWSGKILSIATYKGTQIGKIEFARNIHFAECLENSHIVVGTRYIIHMDTIPQASKNPQFILNQFLEKQNQPNSAQRRNQVYLSTGLKL